MPKKTRQEKVIAQLKRLQQLNNPSATTPADKEPSLKKSSITLDLKSLETSQNTQSSQPKPTTYEYAYVYKDLKKTLFFAALAVIFEFALSRFV